MVNQPHPRRDRYDVSGNVEAQFVDAGETVLVNLAGITDLTELQIREEEGLAATYGRLLRTVRVDTPMTGALIRDIHASIFGELFAWAGRWRTVQISKPGAIWPPPHYLNEAMQSFESDVLMKYPAKSLTTEDAFCAGLAEIQGEFLAIHPFREGNARTIKLLTDLLAAQTGRPLLAYDTSESGCHEYIEAARTALIGQGYAPLETIIRQALHQALQNPSPATEPECGSA